MDKYIEIKLIYKSIIVKNGNGVNFKDIDTIQKKIDNNFKNDFNKLSSILKKDKILDIGKSTIKYRFDTFTDTINDLNIKTPWNFFGINSLGESDRFFPKTYK